MEQDKKTATGCEAQVSSRFDEAGVPLLRLLDDLIRRAGLERGP